MGQRVIQLCSVFSMSSSGGCAGCAAEQGVWYSDAACVVQLCSVLSSTTGGAAGQRMVLRCGVFDMSCLADC